MPAHKLKRKPKKNKKEENGHVCVNYWCMKTYVWENGME